MGKFDEAMQNHAAYMVRKAMEAAQARASLSARSALKESLNELVAHHPDLVYWLDTLGNTMVGGKPEDLATVKGHVIDRVVNALTQKVLNNA